MFYLIFFYIRRAISTQTYSKSVLEKKKLWDKYIHKRVKEIGRAYEVRVLLCLVDVKEPHHCIKELEKISIFSNLTMISIILN